MKNLIPISDELITDKIFIIRGVKVMLDSDLAELYGVETKRLKEQVRRNISVFPIHFMFKLHQNEIENLRSQFATSSWGGSRYLPYVFTEHGILQLANVVKSKRAKQMSIRIIEVFVRMRQFLFSNTEILKKLEQLESKVSKHDEDVQLIFAYLKELLEPEVEPRSPMGYRFKQD